MSGKISILALAVCFAACSGGQQQTTAQSNPNAAPAQAAAPAAAPAPAAQPPADTTAATPPPAASPAPTTGTEAPAAQPAPDASAPATAAPSASAPAATADPAAQKPKAASAAKKTEPQAPKTAAAAPAAEQPPVPEFEEVTIPQGTALNVRLTRAIASDTSRVEDEVRGTLTQSLRVDGVTAVPAGTEVIGTVRSVARSGRVKGRASIAFRFEHLMMPDTPLGIQTATVTREAAADRGGDVKKGAIGAGAGALIGGILGGKKGAAVGAGVGGTGAVVATRGDEVKLAPGTIVRTTLQQPVKILVKKSSSGS
jgi:hypothetical protein